ncbi:MAG TPA: ethanolamine ammonia-lyase subunit EutC [Burkholderiales bacterium]|nr:ethanolamine ammonia-lyase subunit EutC [Burkholderiales bacterium]
MTGARDRSSVVAPSDPWTTLGRFTPARIGLGRAGGSIPTKPMLEFQLAHARARDAVQRDLEADAVREALRERGFEVLELHSAAPDRRTFIQRPDLGRILAGEAKALLEAREQLDEAFDVAFVVADGLSAQAVERHAPELLAQVAPKLYGARWRLAPVCLVRQGRVAVGDEIGALLPAAMTVMLIGERPGLSSPDSLGVYLTWAPLPGRSNAERNCISNVRPEGLGYALAAHKLFYLMTEARRRKLSGVELKEEAPALALEEQSGRC